MTRNAPAWIGIAVLAGATCYLLAVQGFDGARATDADAVARLSTAVGLLIVICGAAMLGLRDTISLGLRQAVSWSAVMLALVVVFAYRAEFREVGGPMIAELLQADDRGSAQLRDRPGERTLSSFGQAGSQAVITAGRGGQFFVEAMVNGHHVQLVADTGATLVALTAEDAQRVGFDPGELVFNQQYRTANGVALAAPVVLDEISVGPVRLSNVRASVSEPGALHISLLGMSFLSQLTSFHIRGDQLVLQQ